MADIEKRNFAVTELRAVEDGEQRKIVGYAAVFNTEARINSWLIEKIEPGAFAKTIAGDDIRSVWNHDSNFVLGRNKAGTLTLIEDERGLRSENIPPDTQWARDFQVSIDRGDVTQMSFAFEVIDQEWLDNEDGTETRTIKEVRLFEVSPVTFPAYTDTTVALRSLESARGSRQQTKMPDYSFLKDEDEVFRSIMGV